MLTTKKISPAEFRLHNKLFYVDYSPSNYFEKFRFELVFQNIVIWFFYNYGVYFYIHKLKLFDTKLLFQLYFYKTYIVKRFIISSRVIEPSVATAKFDEDCDVFFRKLKTVRYLKYYNFKLYQYIRAISRARAKFLEYKPLTLRVRLKKKSFSFNTRIKEQFEEDQENSAPSLSYNFFFTYFLTHFFKYSAIIMYKSLYKLIFSNIFLQEEYSDILFRTRYLRNYRWSYDFIFFLNYAVTFANTNFLFPFLVFHITKQYRQKKFVIILFNFLRTLFFYKELLRGVRIVVSGPYDRHGRTRTYSCKLGHIQLAEYKSFVVYDSIQCPTLYGTISIKLWLQYFNYRKVSKLDNKYGYSF